MSIFILLNCLYTLLQRKKKRRPKGRLFMLALPIFPGRRQPSIVSRNELNFRVRNGNGWTLVLISTNFSICSAFAVTNYTIFDFRPLSRYIQPKNRMDTNGDPYRIRTDVKGVRGLCLNHLTNGPYSRRYFDPRHTPVCRRSNWYTIRDSNPGHPD